MFKKTMIQVVLFALLAVGFANFAPAQAGENLLNKQQVKVNIINVNTTDDVNDVKEYSKHF